MSKDREHPDQFTDLLTRLARVPKREIDEEEAREARNEARRKTPKPAAKPGHIIPAHDSE